MRKKWFIGVLLAVSLLVSTVLPAFAHGGPPSPPYIELADDGLTGKLIHKMPVKIYSSFAVDCNGREYKARFKPPWKEIQWTSEGDEGPLAYWGIWLKYKVWSKRGWHWKSMWVEASRDCPADTSTGWQDVIPEMWLLTRGAPGDWPPCILVSDDPPSVERQKALCFADEDVWGELGFYDPEWVADNALCAGPVSFNGHDMHGGWACDAEMKAWGGARLPLYDEDGGHGEGTLYSVYQQHLVHIGE